MERKLRTCACCGTEYKFCPKCNEDKNKPLFYFTFCSENCNGIYGVASRFENGSIDIECAKTQLEKLDLSKLDRFGDSYKNTINKIMSYTASISSSSIFTTIEEDIVEENNNKEVIIEENEIIVDQPLEVNNDFVEEKSIRKPRARKVKNIE